LGPGGRMEETTLTTSHGLRSVRSWIESRLLVVMTAWSIGIGMRAQAAPDVPASSRLSVEPTAVVLSGIDARQQLAGTFRRADGTLGDVTRACRMDVEPAGLATITPGGVVRPAGVGVGSIRVTADRLRAEVSLRVEDAVRARPASFRADVVPLLSK